MIFSTKNTVADSGTLSNGWKRDNLCIAEGANARIYPEGFTSSSTMTPSECTTHCASLGFTQAGLE